MKRALFCCLALLAAPLALMAQVANNTTLVGTVADPTSGVIAGAHVVGVNRDTKDSYSGDTNGEGYYSIPFVAPVLTILLLKSLVSEDHCLRRGRAAQHGGPNRLLSQRRLRNTEITVSAATPDSRLTMR